jgi:ubiquinone/menaquinone biosynthesis C-methylase UbiE
MKVLDLGCGEGKTLSLWGVSVADSVVGVDVDDSALAIARSKFPSRTYIHAAGEALPFQDESFHRIVSSVALPYMNIPKALGEMYRVLESGGCVSISLHPWGFTWKELRKAFPTPAATIFRVLVLMNGCLFHLTGWAPGESFQTERGMRIALRRAGFKNISFRNQKTPAGERFVAEAVKP